LRKFNGENVGNKENYYVIIIIQRWEGAQAHRIKAEKEAKEDGGVIYVSAARITLCPHS